ncbi:MAG: hypothetical protein IAF94_05145 [Pirellulaceae bacterium]|nr:hypothetical protein [Pirellulaceae bacterium]
MNQSHLSRHMLAVVVTTILASGGCGPSGVQPVGQTPAAPSSAGVVAVRPNIASAAPASTPSVPDAGPIVPKEYQGLPLEARQAIAASNARPAESKAAYEKTKVALDALSAQLAAEAESDRDPTPAEREEDRRLHPAGQIWLTLSNLKVVKGELDDLVISVDYRLVCGSPLKFGFYGFRIYVLDPNETKITDSTKLHERFVTIADKETGTLTQRLLGNVQDVSADRLVVVLVRGIQNKGRLADRQLSGFLTARTSSTDPNPPPLPAALVGAEAQGKFVVLAPFTNTVRRPLITDLDFDVEFQTQFNEFPKGRYQLVMTPAEGGKVIFDITRDVLYVEPYTKGMMRLEGGPVLPSQAPARPFRFHVERQVESGDEWVAVSNVISYE